MARKKRRKLIGAALARARSIARRNFGIGKRGTKRSRNVARKKTRRRGNPSGMTSPRRLTALGIGAGVYGLTRGFLSNFIGQFTQNIPLGNIGDEVVLAVVAWNVARRARSGVIKDAALAGFIVEASRIGASFSEGGGLFGGIGTGTAQAAPMQLTRVG